MSINPARSVTGNVTEEKPVVFRVGGASQGEDLVRIFAHEQLFACNANGLATVGGLDVRRAEVEPGRVTVETLHLSVTPSPLLRAKLYDRDRHEVF
jgi:hypothetical protein